MMNINPINSNCIEIQIDWMFFLFSYSTCVGYCQAEEYFMSNKHFSNTTSKHMSAWSKGRTVEYISQSKIDAMIELVGFLPYEKREGFRYDDVR